MKKLLFPMAIPQAMATSSQGSSEGTRYPIDEPGPRERLFMLNQLPAEAWQPILYQLVFWACVQCSKVGLYRLCHNHTAGSSYDHHTL